MSARLVKCDGAELSTKDLLEVRNEIAATVDGQLATFPGTPRELLLRVLGEERYARLLVDIANNVTQGIAC